MKKIFTCLLLFLFISTTLCAEWQLYQNNDAFGDPSNWYSMYVMSNTTYNNKPYYLLLLLNNAPSYTRNKWRIDELTIDLEDENFNSLITNDSVFSISIKDEKNKVHTFTDLKGPHPTEIQYEMIQILRENKEVKLLINKDFTNYVFQLDTSGFDETLALNKQVGLPRDVPYPDNKKWFEAGYSSAVIDLFNRLFPGYYNPDEHEKYQFTQNIFIDDNEYITSFSLYTQNNNLDFSITLFDAINYFDTYSTIGTSHSIESITFHWGKDSKVTFINKHDVYDSSGKPLPNMHLREEMTPYMESLKNEKQINYEIQANINGEMKTIKGYFEGYDFYNTYHKFLK